MTGSSVAPRHRWLLRPLWRESAVDREHRRGRLIFTGPCGALLGLTFGILAARNWGIAAPALAMTGAVAGFLATHLLGHLDSLVVAVSETRGLGAARALRIAIDVVGGGLCGRFVGQALGADGTASLALGASILVTLSAVGSRIFWGGWVEGAVDLLTGQRSRARAPDHSYPAALVARGEIALGLHEYESLCADRPGDPEPILHAAWTLREHGQWDHALAWFRRALRTASIDAPRAAGAVRQIWEIEVTKNHDLAGPVADLETAIERFPGAEELAWARRELDELTREIDGA